MALILRRGQPFRWYGPKKMETCKIYMWPPKGLHGHPFALNYQVLIGMMKYADNIYPLVGSNHIDTAKAKFPNRYVWAAKNSLCLNPLKTREPVFTKRLHKLVLSCNPIITWGFTSRCASSTHYLRNPLVAWAGIAQAV